MKKIFQYTFGVLSVALLLSTAPSFPAFATGEMTETVQPTPDASQPDNSSPSEAVDVTQPDTPVENIPSDALPPVIPETPALDSATPDTNTVTEPEAFTVTDFNGTYYVATERDLNVRSGPSTSYPALGKLSSGQEITVTGKTDNDWYRIQYTQSREGYVSAQYVSDTPIISTPDTSEVDNTAPTESAVPEAPPETEEEEDTSETEDEPSTYIEQVSSFIGAPATIILVLCIIVVAVLIGISVYSLFHHDTSVDEEDEYDYYEDDIYEEDAYYEEDTYEDENAYYEEGDYYAEYENVPDDNVPQDEDLYIEDIYAEDSYLENDSDVFDEDEYDN